MSGVVRRYQLDGPVGLICRLRDRPRKRPIKAGQFFAMLEVGIWIFSSALVSVS